jgi:hypothetical protein
MTLGIFQGWPEACVLRPGFSLYTRSAASLKMKFRQRGERILHMHITFLIVT